MVILQGLILLVLGLEPHFTHSVHAARFPLLRLSVAPIDTALASDAADPAPVSGHTPKISVSADSARPAPYSDRPPMRRGWFSPRVTPMVQVPTQQASAGNRGFLSANVAAAGALKTRSSSLKFLLRRALKAPASQAQIPAGAVPRPCPAEAAASMVDLGKHAVSDTGLVALRSGAVQTGKGLVSPPGDRGVCASTAAAKPAGRRVWKSLVSYVSGGHRARAQSQNI